VDIVRSSLDKVGCVRRKQYHHLVIWMQMLEFHIDRGIPLIIINVIKDIVRDVVDDYIMVVFIKNTVIYKHVISIYEKKRGSK
jgi:hypothetical protein